MNNTNHKTVLYIDLANKEYDIKSHVDLDQYIGGVGLGLKLLDNNFDDKPLIFSTGPLNGFFPYASKTSVVFSHDESIEDIYLGGSLSFRIRYSGLDSIVLLGVLEEPGIVNIVDGNVSFDSADADIKKAGMPGRRSVLSLEKEGLFLDNYFRAQEKFLELSFVDRNIKSLVISGSKTFPVINKDKYSELFGTLLKRIGDVSVEPGTNPSCSGCPLGCNFSKIGEIGGNILVHSLVACTYSENIYSDVGTVFSCLNVLGYDYIHEDIENLPSIVTQTLNSLSERKKS